MISGPIPAHPLVLVCFELIPDFLRHRAAPFVIPSNFVIYTITINPLLMGHLYAIISIKSKKLF